MPSSFFAFRQLLGISPLKRPMLADMPTGISAEHPNRER